MQQLPVDNKLIQLYLEGKCSNEQLAVIREYLENPAYEQSLEEWLKTDWQNVSDQQYDQRDLSTGKYQEFLKLVQAPAEEPPVKRIQYRKWWRLAAAAAVICIAGYTVLKWKQDQFNRQMAMLEQDMVQVQNKAGKRTIILLPDSSQVYLNAVSNLRYNRNFGKTNRNIILEGEAFFIVKHGKEFPFTVQTGSVKTVDIGTAFNIRFRKADTVIKVAVAEGAVNVETGGELISMLTQNQQLSFDTVTRKASVQELNADESAGGWKDGILVFHKQPLREVARELEDFYGISIRFANDAISNILITSTIRNVHVKDALEIIALTAGVEIYKSENEVLIK